MNDGDRLRAAGHMLRVVSWVSARTKRGRVRHKLLSFEHVTHSLCGRAITNDWRMLSAVDGAKGKQCRECSKKLGGLLSKHIEGYAKK